MDPFVALGIQPDADERQIKRAYAKKLKQVRPDTDPVGFQKLNDCYQRALALRKDRTGLPHLSSGLSDGPDFSEEPPQAAEDPKTLSQENRDADEGTDREIVDQDVAARITRVELLESQESEDDQDAPFSFDEDHFFDGLLLELQKEDVNPLRSWLADQVGSWPFPLRPALANRIISILIDHPASVTPAQLDVITGELGLDDVHMLADPVALSLYKEKVVTTWDYWHGEAARARELEARAEAFRKRDERILYALVIGCVIALAVIAWLAHGGFRYLYQTSDGDSQFEPSLTTPVIYKLIEAAADFEGKGEIDKAFKNYDFILSRPPRADDLASSRLYAVAMYSKATLLRDQNRTAEAINTYRELTGTFQNSLDLTTGIYVAASFVNVGFLQQDLERWEASFQTFEKVTSTYVYGQSDALDVQIAKSFIGEAEAKVKLGNVADAKALISRALAMPEGFTEAAKNTKKSAEAFQKSLEN
ncbi:J domain-containing protein [Oryzifoliimicrobium ureilyticus]|uniref:J domain-containing protein n=1 Tax=Oryzifoliimicrobium ureilyticus TaxID=3113724 RepID=UPI0030767ACF